MTDNSRATVEWVPVSFVIPNPLNPRKKDSVSTQEMQDIIKSRGWEEPLTVYKKGKYYVVLSGHRRLYSAKEVGVKEIPVYIVDQPKDYQEEIERIASLQSGRVDWTIYEWASFTYERWVAWGRPPVSRFARKLNINKSSVASYVTVLDYYPREEVEAGLISEQLSISGLHQLITWTESAKRYKSDLVDGLGEDMVRRVMINKMTNRLVRRDDLRNIDYIIMSDEEGFRDFLFSNDKYLSDCIKELGLENKDAKTFHGHLVSLGFMKKNLSNFNPQTNDEKEKALNSLKDLQMMINERVSKLERDVEKQDTLL